MKLIDFEELEILNYSKRDVNIVDIVIDFNHILDMNMRTSIDAIEHTIAKQFLPCDENAKVVFNIRVKDLALQYSDNKQVADIVANALMRVITQPERRAREKRLNIPKQLDKFTLPTRINVLNAINNQTHLKAFNAHITVNQEKFYIFKP